MLGRFPRIPSHLLSYFFVKKVRLSRRVGYVMDGWISGSAMYVFLTNQIAFGYQISCYKGKWYVRRFDSDTVENGHIYPSVKEEEVFIYWVYLDILCGYVRLRIL